jgi:hypothetical protein
MVSAPRSRGSTANCPGEGPEGQSGWLSDCSTTRSAWSSSSSVRPVRRPNGGSPHRAIAMARPCAGLRSGSHVLTDGLPGRVA